MTANWAFQPRGAKCVLWLESQLSRLIDRGAKCCEYRFVCRGHQTEHVNRGEQSASSALRPSYLEYIERCSERLTYVCVFTWQQTEHLNRVQQVSSSGLTLSYIEYRQRCIERGEYRCVCTWQQNQYLNRREEGSFSALRPSFLEYRERYSERWISLCVHMLPNWAIQQRRAKCVLLPWLSVIFNIDRDAVSVVNIGVCKWQQTEQVNRRVQGVSSALSPR